jgi:hypothetical protein
MKVRASLISRLGPLGRREQGRPQAFREVDMKAKSVRQSPVLFAIGVGAALTVSGGGVPIASPLYLTLRDD